MGDDAESVSGWHLRRLGLRLIARRTWDSAMADELTGRSAQLAYYLFFSLFPGLVAASAMLGLVASSGTTFSDRLLDNLASVIPPAAFQLVFDTFNETARASSGGKLALGIVVALWSASAGTLAIQDALYAMYRVKQPRPYWRASLNAIAFTVLITALFILALSVLLYGDIASTRIDLLGGVPIFVILLARVLAWPIAFAVIALVFALVYSMAPHSKRREWTWISPGAFIGILLWLAASAGLRIYLHIFNSFSATYGSLGAVIVLLTWFYLSGLSLLLGAEINKVIEVLIAERATEDGNSKR
jgi:membrane protein